MRQCLGSPMRHHRRRPAASCLLNAFVAAGGGGNRRGGKGEMEKGAGVREDENELFFLAIENVIIDDVLAQMPKPPKSPSGERASICLPYGRRYVVKTQKGMRFRNRPRGPVL